MLQPEILKMKPTIYKLIILIFLICICINTNGQDYKYSASFRTGVYTGFMLKRLLSNESACAAQIGFRDRGIVISGYRLFHQLALPKKQNYQLFMYYGYGVHFRYYTKYKLYNPFKPWRPDTEFRGNYIAAGLDGLLGLEYRLLKHPFVMSCDISPNFEFGGASVFRVNMDMISVGLAYTF